MTKRQKLRVAKVAVAGDLLWRAVELRDHFGNEAINDIANTLLKQAKFPVGVKVPSTIKGAINVVLS